MEATVATTVDEAAIAQFKGALRGDLLQPGDAGYDEARHLWNGNIDKKPALIARCRGVADVIAAVNFGRDHDLLIAVRGGGHSMKGASCCDGGLMIDLSPMRSVRVDPVRRTARAEAGVLLRELDHECQAFGLATTAGTVSHTGIAGLTLGGGFGWLVRKYGLSVDNLLSVDIVTADGRLLVASETENSDLFWGVRGAGANFGVVTSFEYALHPVGPILVAGPAFYPGAMRREVLRFFREFMADAPDEITGAVVSITAPPAPFIPEPVRGTPIVGIVVCHSGSIEEGMKAVEPLRAFGPPAIDMIGPMPYVALQQIIDEAAPHGWQYYNKGHYLTGLSDEAIETIAACADSMTSPTSNMVLFRLGGAMARVPEGTTAIADRDTPYLIDCLAAWQIAAESDRHIQWARDSSKALERFAARGIYINLLNDEDVERVKTAYPAAHYTRLVALKNQYDPTNLFRLNQNIVPTV